MATETADPPSTSSETALTPSPLTDVPIFLGCILSALLLGAMFIQVLIYHTSLRQDHWYTKATVWFVFSMECISSALAITTPTVCLAEFEHFVEQADAWSFQALSVLSGLVTFIVHCFYAWRIWVLGGNLFVSLAVAVLTLIQCTAVIIAGNKVFLEDKPPSIEPFIGLWLTGNIICDLVITGSLVTLLRNAILILSNSRTRTRVEKIMTVAVETGMITVLGSVLQLAFFLAFRHIRSVHYALFYVLPQLYGNCMMAILNIRQAAVPGKSLHDSNHQKIEGVMLQFGHLSDESRHPLASAPVSPKSSRILRSHGTAIGKGSFLASEKDITESWDNVAVSDRVARFWYSYAVPEPTLLALDASPAKIV